MDCGLSVSLVHPWDFPGKNTVVGCHFLLQKIFLTQGLNLHLLHCRWILYHWASREAHMYIYIVTHMCMDCMECMGDPPSMGFSKQEYWSGSPFSSPGDLPNPGIEPRSPTFQADAFTIWAPREYGSLSIATLLWHILLVPITFQEYLCHYISNDYLNIVKI